MTSNRRSTILLSAVLMTGLIVGASRADVVTPMLEARTVVVGTELHLTLIAHSEQDLAALDIPIRFGQASAPIELLEVRWAGEVSAWDFVHASIDNEKKTVIIGLIADLAGRSKPITLAAASAGEGARIALLVFRIASPDYQAIVEPFTASNPDHELAFIYNELVDGKPIVRTMQPTFESAGESMSGEWANLPSALELSQNVPNPFNPSTEFTLSLPVASDYAVRIYNVAGQLVKSYKGHLDAGVHTLVWDGKCEQGADVASGVYFYSAEVGAFTEARRMVLLR